MTLSMEKIIRRSGLLKKQANVSFWEKYGFVPSKSEIEFFIREVII
jgi:hypothetical protein